MALGSSQRLWQLLWSPFFGNNRKRGCSEIVDPSSKEAESVPRPSDLRVSPTLRLLVCQKSSASASKIRDKKSIKIKKQAKEKRLNISPQFGRLSSKSHRCSLFPFGVFADLCQYLKKTRNFPNRDWLPTVHRMFSGIKLHRSLGSLRADRPTLFLLFPLKNPLKCVMAVQISPAETDACVLSPLPAE